MRTYFGGSFDRMFEPPDDYYEDDEQEEIEEEIDDEPEQTVDRLWSPPEREPKE